jgi:CTP synthase
MPFLEAVRQLHQELGDGNCVFVHTTLVPVVDVVGEQKTKPTQHSVKELRAIGIQPDIIIGRCEQSLKENIKEKIALFCNVPHEAVISDPDVDTIYRIPLIFEEQGLTDLILKLLRIDAKRSDLKEWKGFLESILNPQTEVEVAIVGKYTELTDSYISYVEALAHGGASLRTKVKIRWIEAERFTEESAERVDGIIVPVGFGQRGSEGKIKAIEYARVNKVPFLGICYGFQMAVVEFCRNVLGLVGAGSAEFEPSPTHPVIDLMPEQRGVCGKGATMRLGAQPVIIEPGSLAHRLYQKKHVLERHRHRYEVNPNYIERIEAHGFKFSGRSPDGQRMEIGELPLKEHPYFMISQFHPEFKSRPTKPHPLFVGLIEACLNAS